MNMNRVGEEWRPAVGYEKIFEVSTLGRIRSVERTVRCGRYITRVVPQRILRGALHPIGGEVAVIYANHGRPKRLLVHRLVAMAFIEQVPGKPHVNHIDGKRSHNWASNLEWCTPKENAQHALRTGLIKPVRRARDGTIRPALTPLQVAAIKRRLEAGEGLSEIGRDYDVLPTTIWRIKHRHTWRYIGSDK